MLHGTPVQVIDEDGVNRTPKPLVAIVTSAALRQARYLGMQESALGSESSEALLGEMSSSGFGRGWFDSGTITPQESATELDFSCECILTSAILAVCFICLGSAVNTAAVECHKSSCKPKLGQQLLVWVCMF